MVALFYSILALFLAGTSADASSRIILPNKGIIRPELREYSQVSGFRAEWCAGQICYGRSVFQGAWGVRSVLLKKSDGSEAIYVEATRPAVELRTPVFDILGPVHSLRAEMGRARVTFDERGEVDSVTLWMPSLGELSASRP